MLIDQIIPSLSPSSGGPARTVIHLCDSMGNTHKAQVRLITQRETSSAISLPNVFTVDARIVESASKIKLGLGLPGRQALSRALLNQKSDILHSNGIWHPLNHWAKGAARRCGIPLIVQPHGMLEPWALGHRVLKKRLALTFYQRHDLGEAALFVATAEQEAGHIRQFGLKQPVAVIPNGVDLQFAKNYKDKPKINDDGLRRALFLSRIHPIKGLLNLLDAWAALAPLDWLLQIAGPDEGGHLVEVQTKAKQLGISGRVQYLGEFDDEAKWSVYQNADLFVLPTFSENFGVVVAEALAAGLPVITTTGAPWHDLTTHDCGWWVAPTVEGLKDALFDAFAASPDRLHAMGERGRNYIQRYDWTRIAADMLDVYSWVLGKGSQPACVRLD